MRADARRNRARILQTAEKVFAEKGPAASTEEIAARAGLAIGTIFRHFPTKQALLEAVLNDVLDQLIQDADSLTADGDPATALFDFFAEVVKQAAERKTILDLFARTGSDVQIADAVQLLRRGVGNLLAHAQQAGVVCNDVHNDELIALLAGTCQGALHSGWDHDLQRRTLAIVFRGLRPHAASQNHDL